MEGLTNKQCPQCGETVTPKATFCQACGERLSSITPSAFEPASKTEASAEVAQPEDLVAPVQEFRKLRVMNWGIVALVSVGAAIMFLKSKSLTGSLLVASVMAFIIGSFLLTAVVLSRETVFFAGIPVGARKRQLKKVALACNVILGMFGVLGLIACMATAQFAPMLPMLVYVIPPALNIRALRALVVPG